MRRRCKAQRRKRAAPAVGATLKVNVVGAATAGALKNGVAEFAPESETVGPAVWVQRKLSARGGWFGSVLPSALKFTAWPGATFAALA